MCGIAGIWDKDASFDYFASAQKMTDALRHRGPDGEGHYADKNSGIYLGHRRLSIIDLSDKGAQPMKSADGRYIITFNGEIYNYKELKHQLVKQGETFASQSDTEVLLRLYILEGAACLNKLDGMFAFAIWDKDTKTLFCARDRFGEKPFYYAEEGSSFYFASEIKALLAAGISIKKNQRKLHNFILYGVLEDSKRPEDSFYENIKQLPPAHYITLKQNGRIDIQRYWEVETDEKLNLSLGEAMTEFQRLFDRSVERRLRSDVKVGSSLSGGLDSSSILSSVSRIQGPASHYESFSARFRDFSKDEGRYIDLMNEHCSVNGNPIFIEAEHFETYLSSVLAYQDEPIGSASILAQFMVMKEASARQVPVLLDGQGADEYLAGYPMFLNTYLYELESTKTLDQTEKQAIIDMHGSQVSVPKFSDRIKRKLPKLSLYSRSLRNTLLSSNSPYYKGLHPSLVKEFGNEANPLPCFRTVKEHQRYTIKGRGLNELLRYADRNSMAHSVEVRLPFLDHELVQFAMSIPSQYIIKNGWTKYILRKSMENRLPKEITWRKDKIGYTAPEGRWLKNPIFKDRIHQSIIALKDYQVISEDVSGLEWRYLSLGALFLD